MMPSRLLYFVPEPQTEEDVNRLREALSEEPIVSAYAKMLLLVVHAPQLALRPVEGHPVALAGAVQKPSDHLEEVAR